VGQGKVLEARDMGPHAELDATLQQIVDRIVSGFSPVKIILFGSRARGTGSADCDVDLLVVTDRPGSKRQQAVAIDLALADLGIAKDIVVGGAEELERERDVVGMIAYPASREGIVLYDRAACGPSRRAPMDLIKALLVLAGVPFAPTHDVIRLSGLLPGELALAVPLSDLAPLNRYAVEARYPIGEEPRRVLARRRECRAWSDHEARLLSPPASSESGCRRSGHRRRPVTESP
jgi:predicted nucleotidyltransferase